MDWLTCWSIGCGCFWTAITHCSCQQTKFTLTSEYNKNINRPMEDNICILINTRRTHFKKYPFIWTHLFIHGIPSVKEFIINLLIWIINVRNPNGMLSRFPYCSARQENFDLFGNITIRGNLFNVSSVMLKVDQCKTDCKQNSCSNIRKNPPGSIKINILIRRFKEGSLLVLSVIII